MKLFDKYGTTMVEVYGIERRKEDLVMQANLMETMPADVYLKPAEAWGMVGMILKWQIISYLPAFIFKACKNRKKASKPSKPGNGLEI